MDVLKSERLAVITGADGGMGQEITRAVALQGYHVIMACYNMVKAESKRVKLVNETGNNMIECLHLDLYTMDSVVLFAKELLRRGKTITLLMNNAGTMETDRRQTADGFERTVSVNYVGLYLLTRKLLPLMGTGSRIVNMVSCTYAIGHLKFPDFFSKGKSGGFWRIPVYSNTKLALTLFTLELARRLRSSGITVNAADPGIVSTDIITMHMWFDPLTDIFFRPFIRTPHQGAVTAVSLLLDEKWSSVTGRLFVNGHPKTLSKKFDSHPQQKKLWDETERLLKRWL